jgi:hypothetical protein
MQTDYHSLSFAELVNRINLLENNNQILRKIIKKLKNDRPLDFCLEDIVFAHYLSEQKEKKYENTNVVRKVETKLRPTQQ